jgi:pyruvate,orthophosphate dikinase
MTRAGVPVPPGFTVTTQACNAYSSAGKFPEGMWEQELEALKYVENKTGKKFNDDGNPLLVSCRSGAKFSMPGMMDTVLNLGLTDLTSEAMIKLTGNPRFVYDSYRRLVEMFGSVVLGISDEAFEHPMAEYKANKGYKTDTQMGPDDWKYLVEIFKQIIKKEKGFEFPQDPYKQLELATEAVFKSWNGKRAIDYRRATNIPDDLGTAVNIQTMVFGNMGDDSGTGVAFTRDPSTGDKKMMGDYLLNAQGEDVVAGIRNAEPIEKLQGTMPEVYAKFMKITSRLEDHYKEMQDVEIIIAPSIQTEGKIFQVGQRVGMGK